jgi:PadR family transcriptional regulator, regulatory protein PadR
MSQTVRSSPRRPTPMPFQPTNFLRPCVLLLVEERPGYGYDLQERLRELVAADCDSGSLYRVLNALEDEGLIVSWWEESSDGPQRRCYRVTDAGRVTLDQWTGQLEKAWQTVRGFLDRHAHRRALRSAAAP